MIQEKELRTGNLYATIRNNEIVVKGFDTINKFVVVDAISKDPDITVSNQNSIIFEDLNAIELSEFKISRLGFNGQDDKGINIISDRGASFLWDEEKKYMVLTDGSKGTLGQPIRYVHQFQNIYYLLTGKEFTILPAL